MGRGELTPIPYLGSSLTESNHLASATVYGCGRPKSSPLRQGARGLGAGLLNHDYGYVEPLQGMRVDL